MSHNEEIFEGKDGLKLFSQSWSPDQSKNKKKAAVIIAHGLKDHSSRYSWPAEELMNEGYVVYAFDLRGHGKSGGKRQWVNSFDDYVFDLGTFVRFVRSKEPPNLPIFIFGHSMGGAIVTFYALNNFKANEFDGILLSGPALKSPKNVSPVLIGFTKFLGSVFPSAGVFRPKNEDFSRDLKVVAAMGKDPLISSKAVPARTMAELIRTMEKIQSNMEGLDVPMLLMHGAEDKLANPEGSKQLNQRSHSGDKTLKIYEGLYHDLLHEPEKQNVLNDISEWLAKHS